MNSIRALEGYELSAVSFVRDYVEFHFDGPILRAITPPAVNLSKGEFKFEMNGWRDALCSLIGRKVESIVLNKSQIALSFEGGGEIKIPLTPTGNAVEAMHFVPAGHGPLQVW